jgi:hypothetical protein
MGLDIIWSVEGADSELVDKEGDGTRDVFVAPVPAVSFSMSPLLFLLLSLSVSAFLSGSALCLFLHMALVMVNVPSCLPSCYTCIAGEVHRKGKR